MDSLVILIFALVALYLTLWVIILLPARMAEARGRSAFGWVLISIFFSPFLAVILLFLIGDARRDDR
jgi:hypothetical protein